MCARNQEEDHAFLFYCIKHEELGVVVKKKKPCIREANITVKTIQMNKLYGILDSRGSGEGDTERHQKCWEKG